MANEPIIANAERYATCVDANLKCATERVELSASVTNDGCQGEVDNDLQSAHTTWFNEVAGVLDLLTNKDVTLGKSLGEGMNAETFVAVLNRDMKNGRRGDCVAVKRTKTLVPEPLYKEVMCLHKVGYSTSREDDEQYVSRVLGFNATDFPFFIVMELIDGPTLAAEIKRAGAFPLPKALAATRDLLQVLRHAQACGIVHRDIKSLNIMLTSTQKRKLGRTSVYPMAKVVDWGECAAMYTEEERTNEVGTLRWMAPEMMGLDDPTASIDYSRYGAPVDMFSLGCVLYHMLTGKVPYHQIQSNIQVVFAINKGIRPSFDDVLFDTCPALLQFFIRCCFHVNPEARPTVTQAMDILELVMAGKAKEELDPARDKSSLLEVFVPAIPDDSPAVPFITGMGVMEYIEMREVQEHGFASPQADRVYGGGSATRPSSAPGPSVASSRKSSCTSASDLEEHSVKDLASIPPISTGSSNQRGRVGLTFAFMGRKKRGSTVSRTSAVSDGTGVENVTSAPCSLVEAGPMSRLTATDSHKRRTSSIGSKMMAFLTKDASDKDASYLSMGNFRRGSMDEGSGRPKLKSKSMRLPPWAPRRSISSENPADIAGRQRTNSISRTFSFRDRSKRLSEQVATSEVNSTNKVEFKDRWRRGTVAVPQSATCATAFLAKEKMFPTNRTGTKTGGATGSSTGKPDEKYWRFLSDVEAARNQGIKSNPMSPSKGEIL